MTEPVYDFVCSIGELIDKLTIENIKCYDANNKIIALRAKDVLDSGRVASLELAARTSGEQRVRLRDEINRRLMEALIRGSLGCARDVRTYDTAKGDHASGR